MKEMSKVSIFTVLRYAIKKHSICIVAPYYTKEKMSDGYFRRVAFSDDLLSSLPRIFIDLENPSKTTFFQKIDDKKIVLHFSPNKIVRIIIPTLVFIFCHRVYFESVWQVRKKFLYFPFLKAYIDMHGSVPEEEFLGKRYTDAQKYGEIEEATVKRAKHIFCVSEAMARHLREKYGDKLQATTSILPIVDQNLLDGVADKSKKTFNKTPVVIYAGGIFEWQNIEEMQEAIKSQAENTICEVYTPTPELFWKTWTGKRTGVKVEAVAPDFLRNKAYPRANYGFVLRDDIVVNKVACPTKIAEYLRYGIIPIMKSPRVGDFFDLGMRYMPVEDFIQGKFFTEKQTEIAIAENYKVLDRYIESCHQGIKDFKRILVNE